MKTDHSEADDQAVTQAEATKLVIEQPRAALRKANQSTWRLGIGSVVQEAWFKNDVDMMLDILDGRTYWATDRSDNSQELARNLISYCDKCRCPTSCLKHSEWRLNMLPKGWLSDFWFYTRNNHPLLGIFLADAHHPLLVRDRILIEGATLCITFASAYVYRTAVKFTDVEAVFYYYLSFTFAVTIPGLLAFLVLWNSLACPCCQRKESWTCCSLVARQRFKYCGQLTMWPLTLLVCYYAAELGYYSIKPENCKNLISNQTAATPHTSTVDCSLSMGGVLAYFLLGRLQGYFFFFVRAALLTFNWYGI
jgi:hypothetical protein